MSEPIRILHMIGTLEMGGSQAMVLNLYKAIDRTKIQFDFILDHPEMNALLPVVEELGARVYYMPSFKGSNILQIRKEWIAFFENHPEYRILHSHVRSYASVFIPIAKKFGLKTIIHSHSTSNGTGISSIVKSIMQYPLRYQADYFFGCSTESGNWLFGEKVVKSSRFFVIKNAIDTRQYVYSKEISKKYRDELGISSEHIVFLHVGRLHEAKNHKFLLEVFAGVLKQYTNAILLLVGAGDLEYQIKEKITELGLTKNVFLLGARRDVPCIMQAADIFLFPSIWEGVPVTVVEAQAAGLKCLVSDTVTKEVQVSNLIEYLPISNGIEPWIDRISRISTQKEDVVEKIIEAGFDIQTSALWLTHFYELLTKGRDYCGI